jgi:glycosyltransferase involved in cell wall biosynthesis
MQHLSAIRKVAFLGDYLPRKCGIATFTTDLRCAMASEFPALQCLVVPVNDLVRGYDYPPEVRFEIAEQDLPSYLRAADFLNITGVDVLCVQHEFGIYGGMAGSHVLALLSELRMPIVTTLHTVLREPNGDQMRVMRDLIRFSTRLVVMSERGREFLRDVYHAPEAKIDLTPRGIPNMPFADPNYFKDEFGVAGKNVLLTFGLLSPNKGIEFALRALPNIIREFPNIVYIVLGQTHPSLLRNEGEAYRLSLERLASDLGVQKHVVFFNRFVELEELMRFIGAADIYLTPYLTEAQITSGTLAYAFGAGNAVISTPYWHAAELLTAERGKLVPFRDAKAIPVAVVELLRDEPLRHAMRKNAYKLGRDMVWGQVGATLRKILRAGTAGSQFRRTKTVAHQDARRTARTIVGAETRSSVPDERFDRHLPTRELHGAQFRRRLLHGRQRPCAGIGLNAAEVGARFAAFPPEPQGDG